MAQGEPQNGEPQNEEPENGAPENEEHENEDPEEEHENEDPENEEPQNGGGQQVQNGEKVIHLSEAEKAKIKGVLDMLNIPHEHAKWDSVVLPKPDHLTSVDWVKKEHSGHVNAQMDVISPYVQSTTQTNCDSRTMVEDYCRYQDISIPGIDNVAIRYGVSLRRQVEIRDIQTNAKITSLPLIAASSTLGFCSSTVSLSARGLPALNLPDEVFGMQLTVATYPQYDQALRKLMKQVDEPDIPAEPLREGELHHEARTVYEPQILFVIILPKEDKLKEAVNITYAIGCVAAGKTQEEALGTPPAQDLQSAVTSVYEYFNAHPKPKHSHQELAKCILNGLHISKRFGKNIATIHVD